MTLFRNYFAVKRITLSPFTSIGPSRRKDKEHTGRNAPGSKLTLLVIIFYVKMTIACYLGRS